MSRNFRSGALQRFAASLLTLGCFNRVHASPRPAPSGELVKRATNVPSYVTDYAPIAYLDTNEQYFPSDLGQQLVHTTPRLNNQTIPGAPNPVTLDNLNQLNQFGTNGTNVYLTSNEGIEALPAWFNGIQPDANGTVNGGTTCAVVVVDKGGGEVDAFYFYFYAYNEGNSVDILGGVDLGQFGDHVGDWEHSMLRFQDGVPQAIWLSQHSGGEAFTYSAMSKYQSGCRPIIYVAQGTHANYAIPGPHDHTIPGVNLPADVAITDQTSQGPLYDPVASAYFYTYNVTTEQFAAYDGTSPTGWLYFMGLWGDEQLPNDAPGQVVIFGQAKYSSGPTGPEDKDLNRTTVCNYDDVGDACVISPVLTD